METRGTLCIQREELNRVRNKYICNFKFEPAVLTVKSKGECRNLIVTCAC